MSFRSLALGLSLLAGLAALSGCGVAPDEGEGAALGEAQGPIMGGYDDATDTNVVDIAWISGNTFSECSGSLLAPNMVLTARHCVANILNGDQGIDCSIAKFTSADPPANFFVSTKQYLSMNPADYHDVVEVFTPTPTGVCGNDMAILILKDNIQPSEATPLVPKVDAKSVMKEQYSAVGFGNTNDTTGAGQRRRLDNLFVNCIGSQCGAAGFIDTKTEFLGDHGICEGDSGGPALDLQNRVIGVTSRGGAGCTSPVYGYVFGWADWIKQTGLHAAMAGGYEAPGWAQGYSTDPQYGFPITDNCPMEGCPSGLCLSDSNGSYCTRACADNAPCPDGYDCAMVEGQPICQRPPPAVTPPSTTPGSTGCSAAGADPTKPVPWRVGAAMAVAGLALLRRRRRGSTVGR